VKKIVLLLLALSLSLFGANQIKTGSKVSELNTYSFETPQGKSLKIPASPKLIIIAFEKDTAAFVNEYLNSKTPPYLPKHRALFIADIHAMPSIISRMFALPKLRKYRHIIYLHYQDEFQNVIPNKEDEVTLLHVQNGQITNITFAKNKQELQDAIER